MKVQLKKKNDNFLYGKFAGNKFKAFDFSAAIDGAITGHGNLHSLIKKKISLHKKIIVLSGLNKLQFYKNHLGHFFLNSGLDVNNFYIGLIDKLPAAEILNKLAKISYCFTTTHKTDDPGNNSTNNLFPICNYDWEFTLTSGLDKSNQQKIYNDIPFVLQTYFCAKALLNFQNVAPNNKSEDQQTINLAKNYLPNIIISSPNHEFLYRDKLLVIINKHSSSTLPNNNKDNNKDKLLAQLVTELKKEEAISIPQLAIYSAVISKSLQTCKIPNINLKTGRAGYKNKRNSYPLILNTINKLQKQVNLQSNKNNSTKHANIICLKQSSHLNPQSHYIFTLQIKSAIINKLTAVYLDASAGINTSSQQATNYAEYSWHKGANLIALVRKGETANRYYFFYKNKKTHLERHNGISFYGYEQAGETKLVAILPLHIQINHLKPYLQTLIKAVQIIIETNH